MSENLHPHYAFLICSIIPFIPFYAGFMIQKEAEEDQSMKGYSEKKGFKEELKSNYQSIK